MLGKIGTNVETRTESGSIEERESLFVDKFALGGKVQPHQSTNTT